MFLGLWEEAGVPRETPPTHTQAEQAKSTWLWGDSVDHYTTVPGNRSMIINIVLLWSVLPDGSFFCFFSEALTLKLCVTGSAARLISFFFTDSSIVMHVGKLPRMFSTARWKIKIQDRDLCFAANPKEIKMSWKCKKSPAHWNAVFSAVGSNTWWQHVWKRRLTFLMVFWSDL